jgi:tetratricopeptide (TPR) repeat protein
MTSGKERSFRIGLTNAFNTPKTSATSSSPYHGPLYAMPETTLVATQSATVLTIIRTKNCDTPNYTRFHTRPFEDSLRQDHGEYARYPFNVIVIIAVIADLLEYILMGKKSKKIVGPNKAIRHNNTSAVHAPFSSLSWTDNPFVHITCLVFLIIIIYGNTFNAPFQWDETDFIVKNPIIKDLHYFSSPSDAKGFELYSALIIRYIGYLTFALNYKIHGFSVTGYHIVNISIHIANSILVYLLVSLTFRTPFMKGMEQRAEGRGQKIAFFSSLLFAVHPLQTEAVTYVFQRFASLAAFFYLLSLTAYIKSRLALTTERAEESFDIKQPKKVFWSAQSSSLCSLCSLWLVLSFFSAVLAMKTKENAFTLPFIIALYEFCFFSSPSPRVPASPHPRVFCSQRFLILATILFTLGIIPLTLMSIVGTHNLDPGSYGATVFSRWDYFFTQFRVIVTYLRLLFFPANQNFDYDYPIFKSFFDAPVVLSFVFLAALLGLGVYMAIDKGLKAKGSSPIAYLPDLRLMGFGILWFFITISVESSIIPISMIINEYRTYLPSIGIIISVVAGVFMLKEKLLSREAGKIIPVVLFLAIGLLSVATHLRNEVWADSIRLWEDTVKKSPGKARSHFNLANHYEDLNMFDQAIEQHLIAISLKPDYAEAHNNLGSIYLARNMFDKAMDQYLIAVKLSPDSVAAHNNLGNIYQTRNMPDEAVKQYMIAIKLKPDFAEGYYNLGNIYQAHNMPEKAMEQFMIAVNLWPDYAEAHNNIGVIYQYSKMFDKAIEQYIIAVNLKPDFADAHYNLGLVYYNIGQMENARRELTKALKIKPDYQKARQLLQETSR